jgi:hypothetical protein
MLYFSNALAAISFILVLLVIVFLIRGPIRTFPLIFIYALCSVISTVAEGVVLNFDGPSSRLYNVLYYSDEVALNLLLFLMVTSLTYLAMEGNPKRAMAGRVLAGVVVVVLLLPFVIFNPPRFRSHWYYHTSQLLSFGGAILNLFLWTALLGSRRRDPRLLMVSAGVGVAVTGAAISYGALALLNKAYSALPEILLGVTHVVSVFILCWAFRPQPKPRTAPRAVTST